MSFICLSQRLLYVTGMYITLKINFKIITYSDVGSNTISWSDTSKGPVSPFLFPDHQKSKMSQSTDVDLDGQVSPTQDKKHGGCVHWSTLSRRLFSFQSQKCLSILRASKKLELSEAVSFKSRALSKNLGRNASTASKEQSLLPLSAGLRFKLNGDGSKIP